jgi:L-asparaginase II
LTRLPGGVETGRVSLSSPAGSGRPTLRADLPPKHEPLAYVLRSGLVESVHYGSMIVLGPDGDVVFATGEPDAVHYPRSAMKPVQAAAMVRLGLRLPPDLLALAASSHSGERRHVDGVRRILAEAGVGEDELRNPADRPLDQAVRDAHVAAGQPPSRLVQNCSGKHAAMLATARGNDWPTAGYLDPAHPLQQAIAATVTELAGERPAHVAVDGCGAPLFAVTLRGLARAAAAIATAQPQTAEAAVAEAIRRHPEMLGGTDRSVTRLIRQVPGLIAKDGYEGVQIAALPDGSAVAVKVADGSPRPRDQLTAAGLVLCGVEPNRVAGFLADAAGSGGDGVRLAGTLAERVAPVVQRSGVVQPG